MKQPSNLPEIGTKLITHAKLESERGLTIHFRRESMADWPLGLVIWWPRVPSDIACNLVRMFSSS